VGDQSERKRRGEERKENEWSKELFQLPTTWITEHKEGEAERREGS
jgi:hypothetical protein